MVCCDEVLLPWKVGNSGFGVSPPPPPPQIWKKKLFHILDLFRLLPAPVKWSWTVHEWFLNSSWTLIHEQFMNYPWTWNGQVHEVGEVHELGVHKFEFMNLWVHELFMNYCSWIVHELLVHFVHEQFFIWYMNSSGIVHEHLFMNSSWIVHE